MLKVCKACGVLSEHASGSATTCNKCISHGYKWYTAQAFFNKERLLKILGGDVNAKW